MRMIFSNDVKLIGRLATDPVTRYSKDEIAITTFSLACDRGKKANGEPAGVDYIPCKIFGKQGEALAHYRAKGYVVLLHGHLQTNSYEKDGKKVYALEVIGEEWEFPLKDPNKDGATAEAEKQARLEADEINKTAYKMAQEKAEEEIPEGFNKLTDDDIPF